MTEATAAYPDWNSEGEKRGVLEQLGRAKAVVVGLE
jgi:hypothetical protein